MSSPFTYTPAYSSSNSNNNNNNNNSHRNFRANSSRTNNNKTMSSSCSSMPSSTQQPNRQRSSGAYKQRQQQQQSQKNQNSRRRGNSGSNASASKSEGCPYAFCPGSANGRHSYGPCPKVLFRVVCGFCGLTKKYDRSKNKPTYLRYRRNVRNECQLQTLVAPLVPESRAKVESVLRTCGLHMSPSQRRATMGPAGVVPAAGEPFLTLMDAVVPDEEANASLADTVQQALASSSSSSSFQMRKMHKIRRKDKVTDLVIADVNVSPMLTTALSGATASKTMLPQFPVHLTLGVAPRARKVSANAVKLARELLRGVDLRADATRVQLLAGPGSSAPMFASSTHHGAAPYCCTTEATAAMMSSHPGAFVGSNLTFSPPMSFELDEDDYEDEEEEDEEDEDLSWELANCSLTSLTSASSIESSATSCSSSRPSLSPILSMEEASTVPQQRETNVEDDAAAALPAGLDLSFLAEDEQRAKKADDTTMSTMDSTDGDTDNDDDDDYHRRATEREDASPSPSFLGSSPVCVSDVFGTGDASEASTAGPCLPSFGEPSRRGDCQKMSTNKKRFDPSVLPYRPHSSSSRFYTFSGVYGQG